MKYFNKTTGIIAIVFGILLVWSFLFGRLSSNTAFIALFDILTLFIGLLIILSFLDNVFFKKNYLLLGAWFAFTSLLFLISLTLLLNIFGITSMLYLQVSHAFLFQLTLSLITLAFIGSSISWVYLNGRPRLKQKRSYAKQKSPSGQKPVPDEKPEPDVNDLHKAPTKSWFTRQIEKLQSKEQEHAKPRPETKKKVAKSETKDKTSALKKEREKLVRQQKKLAKEIDELEKQLLSI